MLVGIVSTPDTLILNACGAPTLRAFLFSLFVNDLNAID